MQLRDRLVLEYLARSYSMSTIAKELQIDSSIVSKIIKRLEKRGLIFVDRSVKPCNIKTIDATPPNGRYIQRGRIPTWALRNFAVKFTFSGNEPSTWRKFKKGWRGGAAYIKYVRNSRVEAYIGKHTRTLIVYAPRDMDGDDARVLQHEAIEWCKKTAYFLAEKLEWSIEEQYSLSGGVIPIKKGEYECRPLKPYAKRLKELGLLPIFHKHGKIDTSPKPHAHQTYTAEHAARIWEAPIVIDKLAENFETYNQNIVKHLAVLDEMSLTMKEIRDGLKKGEKKP